jgi:hypothetical protein
MVRKREWTTNKRLARDIVAMPRPGRQAGCWPRPMCLGPGVMSGWARTGGAKWDPIWLREPILLLGNTRRHRGW